MQLYKEVLDIVNNPKYNSVVCDQLYDENRKLWCEYVHEFPMMETSTHYIYANAKAIKLGQVSIQGRKEASITLMNY